MTKIQIGSTCLQAIGHSGYAERGKDLVCAGVSTLVYMVINAVSEMDADNKLICPMQVSIVDGGAGVSAEPKPEHRAELAQIMHIAEIGFNCLADKYPEYLSVIPQG